MLGNSVSGSTVGLALNLECPECACEIQVPPGTFVGEILACSDCGAELEVFRSEETGDFELMLAPQEEEDWGE